MNLTWKIGVEIELLAPAGKNRRDLAERVAADHGGEVRPYFFPDAEPSKVRGQQLFHNLTPAFEALDAEGQPLAKFVDDITIQDDLRRDAKPATDWYRVVSDDKRILRLVERHTDPSLPIGDCLRAVGGLFATEPEACGDGMIRLADEGGLPVAMASGLPGERERPCEVVTAPIETDHARRLEALLAPARELGFTAPVEGAVHLHFDAERLKSGAALYNIAALLHPRRRLLRRLIQTNPRCRRLGPWPDKYLEIVRASDLPGLEWGEVRKRMRGLKLSKYCDFNVRNIIDPPKGKDTLEVRIMPVHLEAEPILDAAALFEAVLVRASSSELVPWPGHLRIHRGEAQRFFDELELDGSIAERLMATLRRPPPTTATTTGPIRAHSA